MKNIKTLINWSIPHHREKVYEYLKTLNDELFWFTTKKYHPKRSTDQNSYWWSGIVKAACEVEGYDYDVEEDRNRMHEKLKLKFNSETVTFKRKVFEVIDQSILEDEKIFDYLEKKEFKNLTLSKDKNILIPLYLTKHIENIESYGKEIEVIDYETLPISTTANDTWEMSQLIERVRDHYAIEHNYYIPTPDEWKTSKGIKS